MGRQNLAQFDQTARGEYTMTTHIYKRTAVSAAVTAALSVSTALAQENVGLIEEFTVTAAAREQ